MSTVIAYAGRYRMKKIMLFIDHDTYHKTKNAKFMRYMLLKNQIGKELDEDEGLPGKE